MYTDLEHVCEEQIEMSKPNEVSDFDLLADSGYTEDMSQLSPVKNVDKSDSHLNCPSLNFSDDEMYQNCIEKRNTIEDSDVEPQHIRNSIIKTDIEFIEKEITPARIQVEEILTSDDDMFCTCPIFCLPREITMKIFTYFTQPELCCKLSRVCKSWYDYAFDPSLWKVIDLHNYRNIPSVNLCRLIAKATNLRSLLLHGRENISESEVAVFTEYTSNLQHLDLGFCQNMNITMLSIIVNKCPMLESINLEGDTCLKPGSLQILSRCEHLKEMNFSHCILENMDLHHLAKNLETIRSLNIDGISWIDDEPVIYLLQQHNKYLTKLVIDGAEITDDCYKSIAICSYLTSFEASFCELLTDKSLEYLQNLNKLKTLRLRKGTEFTAVGLMNFFSSPGIKHLTSLDMSECTGCDDSCVSQLAQSCGKTLKQLSLCWCWHITDRGATSVVDHCSNLLHLDLTGIDKINGDCFGRVPTEMPHLRLLDLKQCNRVCFYIFTETLNCSIYKVLNR
ncbi:FBXL2_20 [Mytilus coruscus]|uniref:FBXL2_20 n=1 Tax=Mytilus coruscus TaxID=42192 RepID=A0A6J8E6C6_MYTCO|nr:FBXL2_20 [Mytilus coruscus]